MSHPEVLVKRSSCLGSEERSRDELQECQRGVMVRVEQRQYCFLLFQCSATCGSGTRKRIVKCYEIKSGLKSRACPMAGKPHHYENCNTKACPTTKTGKFS